MKRDMDLIRAILLKVESDGKIDIPGDHADEEIADHVLQMREEGLVEGEVIKNREGIPCHAVVTRLTSKGHEFLNAISDQRAVPSRELQQATASESTYSYCYQCGGDRNHEILKTHRHEESFPDPASGEMITFGEISQLLKCNGCGFVSMRKMQWSSEMDYDDQPVWRYFPPQHSKPLPKWLKDLQEISNLPLILRCFIQCYEAFSANAVWLACVGARSVLEQVMIAKVSDQRSFPKNLKAFKDGGYISEQDENRLEVLVEAGHASTHRSFDPKREDVSTILDVLSNLLESLYFDENKLTALRNRIPARKS